MFSKVGKLLQKVWNPWEIEERISPRLFSAGVMEMQKKELSHSEGLNYLSFNDNCTSHLQLKNLTSGNHGIQYSAVQLTGRVYVQFIEFQVFRCTG